MGKSAMTLLRARSASLISWKRFFPSSINKRTRLRHFSGSSFGARLPYKEGCARGLGQIYRMYLVLGFHIDPPSRCAREEPVQTLANPAHFFPVLLGSPDRLQGRLGQRNEVRRGAMSLWRIRGCCCSLPVACTNNKNSTIIWS